LYLCKTKIHFLRYFISLTYNGTDFHGWQWQPNAISVQQLLQDGLTAILKKEIKIVGAGRTDAHVHAEQFYAHFDFDNIVDTKDLVYRLNSFLPITIVVYNIFLMKDNAHARFDAISRTYQYHIYLGRNPFMIETAWQLYNKKLDIKKMNQAAKYLLDYTNFKCFSKSNTDVKTYDCKIEFAQWKLDDKKLIFTITANRFLRNMVRAIVGTLYDIGIGKNSPESIKDIIESRNRQLAGFSVPAAGLFLTNIDYPENLFM